MSVNAIAIAIQSEKESIHGHLSVLDSKTHIDCCFQVIDIDVEFWSAGLGDLVDLGHHTLIWEDVARSGKGLHLVGRDSC